MLHSVKSGRKIQTCTSCRGIYGGCYRIDGIDGCETENQRFCIRRRCCCRETVKMHLQFRQRASAIVCSADVGFIQLSSPSVTNSSPGHSPPRSCCWRGLRDKIWPFTVTWRRESVHLKTTRLHLLFKMLRASLDGQQHMSKCNPI